MPIIINSGSYSDAGWWTDHLKKAETNERVEIVGFYGLSAESIEDAFSEMRVMAQGSKRCTNFFSQYNINPRADEHLTEAQWEEAHALHRKNHGLDHLPYFRVRHVKEGRVHEHGIALRVDPETSKAISDSLTAAINERTARALEIKFDLQRGHSVLTASREFERPERRPQKRETFREGERKVDVEIVKADARAARQQADNGQSFKAALEASGAYMLAAGDRRDFVIIDRAGEAHSLAKRLGMKTAALRAFMQDVDPASLPSVAEAKAQQRDAPLQIERQAAEIPPQHFDRDVANAQWEEKIIAAAIAKSEAPATTDGRQRPEPGKGIETHGGTARGRYVDLQPPEMAAGRFASVLQEGQIIAVDGKGRAYRHAPLQTPQPAPEAKLEPPPLGKTAGAIRAAWSFTRTVGDLGEALAAHGISLARVSAADAEASTRPEPQQRQPQAKTYEPWMTQDGGVAGLSDEYRESAQRSYERWTERNPELGRRHDFADYVNYVQGKWAEEQRRPEDQPPRMAPRYREGEIVAVDGWGEVYRLTERTTGDTWPEIAARLAKANREDLLNVADAKEAMREASRAAFIAERQAEREQARPKTEIEAAIAGALKSTMTGTDFAIALDELGLTIARADDRDQGAVDALREQEGFDRQSGLARHARHFEGVISGDFAAVTKQGDVFRLNPRKLDLEDITQRLADTHPRMASIVEARAAVEITRERIAGEWADVRDEMTRARVLRHANRQTEQAARALDVQINQAGGSAERGVTQVFSVADKALSATVEAIAAPLEGLANFIGDALSAPPSLTPEQAQGIVRAADEAAEARERAAPQQAWDAARAADIDENVRQQQNEQTIRYSRFGVIRRDQQHDQGQGQEIERDH